MKKDKRESPSASMSSPNYMRDTSSSSARKLQFHPISDSILSTSAITLHFPDSIKPHSNSRPESQRTPSSVSGCSYNYCSLHGHQHQHHASSPSLKEFISATKRVNNQNDKKLRKHTVHPTSATKLVNNPNHKNLSMHFPAEEEDIHGTTVAKMSTEWTPRRKSHSNIRNNLKHLKGQQKALKKELPESHLEERGTTQGKAQKEPDDAIPLPVNAEDNWDTVFESSHLSNELPIHREGSTPCLAKEHALRAEELQGDKSFNITVIPSVAIRTSPDKRGDTTQLNCEDKEVDIHVLDKQLVGHCHQATKVAIKTSMHEGNHSSQNKTFMDTRKYTSLWDLDLQDVKTDLVDKGEMSLSEKTDIEGNTNNDSEFSPKNIHYKGMDIQAPPSFEFHEDEAIKLIEEAINELLTLPEQATDNLLSSICTNSNEAVWDEVLENCREASLSEEETKHIFATLEDEKASPRKNLSNIYDKLSKVIMCRNFVKAINKMRLLKLKSPQLQHTTGPEAEGTLSLHETEITEKKSWQEWMLDYALQQVVSKLAPAQRKRVALLVQAFEIVSSHPKVST